MSCESEECPSRARRAQRCLARVLPLSTHECVARCVWVATHMILQDACCSMYSSEWRLPGRPRLRPRHYQEKWYLFRIRAMDAAGSAKCRRVRDNNTLEFTTSFDSAARAQRFRCEKFHRRFTASAHRRRRRRPRVASTPRRSQPESLHPGQSSAAQRAYRTRPSRFAL